MWGGGENLGPCTKLNQKCMVESGGWPHQKVAIYLWIFQCNFLTKIVGFSLIISSRNINVKILINPCSKIKLKFSYTSLNEAAQINEKFSLWIHSRIYYNVVKI